MNTTSSDLAEDDETQMIDKVDIIWPTMNLMKCIGDEYKKRFPKSRRSVSHFAFLSSQGKPFNFLLLYHAEYNSEPI